MTRRSRILIIAESALIFLVVAAIIVISSYAWFVQGTPSTDFDVKVTGSADIDVAFYDAWEAVEPCDPSLSFVKEESFYPGLSVQRKIAVINKGKACKFSISFTDLSVTVSNLPQDGYDAKRAALIEYSNDHFLIFSKTDGEENTVKFIADADAGREVTVISNVALAENQTVYVYYRFYYDVAATVQEGILSIAAQGIRVVAV